MLNKPCKVLPTPRDLEMLYFLWRHRVATFQTLRQVFYADSAAETAYNRLRRLRTANYVNTGLNEKNGKPVWCLGPRGFRHLQSVRLPELKSNGYRPNSFYHDIYSMAALLGDWWRELPDGITLITEQELLTASLDSIPAKIQEAFKHRPDGLWLKTDIKEPSAIALEMELTGKSDSRYEEICSFYASFHFVENVIWVVPTRSLARKIERAAQSCAIHREGFHIYVLLEDFENQLWGAKLLNNAMADTSLAEILSQKLEKTYRRTIVVLPEAPPDRSRSPSQGPINSPLLDFSLSIPRFNAYAKKRIVQNV